MRRNAKVKIVLDKERTLWLNLNALEIIEETTGQPLEKIDFNRIKNVKILLWAGLMHEDPALTLDDVGKMIDTANFEQVKSRLTKSWAAAKGGGNPLARSGSSSGPSPDMT